MSKESQAENAAVEAITQRSTDLVAEYTRLLDQFVNQLVPPVLDNAEYAARTSALMIAVNRELARCAAAFGETHGVDPEQMIRLVIGQFTKNFSIALDAMEGQGKQLQ